MDRKMAMSIIQDLARSQGFYGRLLETLNTADPDDLECFWEHFEETPGIDDPVDLVRYFES